MPRTQKPKRLERMPKARKQLLTPLVLRKIEQLDQAHKHFATLWMKTKTAEFLPEGVMFKISGDPLVSAIGELLSLG